MGSILLTREQFRDAVFGRDKFKCVVCGGPGIDAHHILDRKLFPDGGYYLDNGVTLCGKCHLLAETSDNHNYSPQTLRAVTAILVPVLPPGFDPALQYDKWGAPIKYPQHTILGISNPSVGGLENVQGTRGLSQTKKRKLMRGLRGKTARGRGTEMLGVPREAQVGVSQPKKEQTRRELPTMPNTES